MNIEMYDETNQVKDTDKELVQSLLTFAAKQLKVSSQTEISITFVTNERIQEINHEYRGIDAPTDVISFAIQEEMEDVSAGWEQLEGLISEELGDLFISIEKASEQAKEYGHSFERELGFLALHGFLHLNGFDHMTEEDEKEMFGLQKKILKEYGLERFS